MGYEGPYEMMTEVEQVLCLTCVNRKNEISWGSHAEQYPMCSKVENLIIEHEDVVPPLVMRPDGMVTCTEYKSGDPLPEADPEQLLLGE